MGRRVEMGTAVFGKIEVEPFFKKLTSNFL